MRKSGVSDYEAFARKVLETITDRPISFEVFADDPAGMLRQARLISSWGDERLRQDPGDQHQGANRRRRDPGADRRRRPRST